MNYQTPPNHRLADRLRRQIKGDVHIDRFNRGRYATDASFYQIEPVAVVVPEVSDDVTAAITIAREEGVSILPRGGGTSQSGQTVGRSLVIDFTKHLNKIVDYEDGSDEVTVQPGIVLDDLNRQLKQTGLWFPVDVSTASRATIGGMAGNNSCGTRSIRYGIMRDNVRSIDAWLADGTEAHFGTLPANFEHQNMPEPVIDLFRDLRHFGQREANHIASAFPEVSRRVGGYLLDAVLPSDDPTEAINTATLLCGSEGTLAVTKALRLKLSRQPTNKTLGICHFATFRSAMEAAQHIVKLGPVAVELVDRTLIELARDINMFRPVMDAHVHGKPDALLLVEFAEDIQVQNVALLDQLETLLADLGHPKAVTKVLNPHQQKSVWEVRAAGLNIMMSMKSEGKPVSFIEDCAVPLEHLADYTERLTEVFTRHDTRGTWYAHASVGCLHVRPVLNLKLEHDVKRMRAIAEEAFELVRAYKGAHSGEHGDGLVRSEFHEQMYGEHTVRLFEEIKDRFDPSGHLNPGKIVRPPRMDDRSLFRFKPDYKVHLHDMALDWSAYHGAGRGFQGAVEMCNNNGACRKLAGGVMCPSYRVTRNERDSTRGRANTLRLAMSGQLGEQAFTSAEMQETMALCVSCKACRRECPTGVDMARMKLEVLAARNNTSGLKLRDRLIAYLPRFAPTVSKYPQLMNFPARSGYLRALLDQFLGLSSKRALPRWAGQPFRPYDVMAQNAAQPHEQTVVLFADTFNRYFEPENLEAAVQVLTRLGYDVVHASTPEGERPLCCGRTFLAAGLVDQAKAEAARTLRHLRAYLDRGATLVGLEPSCLFSLHDEFQALLPGAETEAVSRHAMLLEDFLVREANAGRLATPIGTFPGKVLIHAHCHQKAFGTADAIASAFSLFDGLETEMIETSCCGMAGSFGYQSETQQISIAMGELSLLPAIRDADADVMIAADGFSCRHQIRDGTHREAKHVAVLIRDILAAIDTVAETANLPVLNTATHEA